MRVISKRKLYAYASLSTGFSSWGLVLRDALVFTSSVSPAGGSMLWAGLQNRWESEPRLSEGFVTLLRFCIIAVSLPAVLPFKIWNKSLCFSHHLSALFCTIHLHTDLFFVLTISLSLITEHWTSRSHSFFFFKIWKKKKRFVCLFIYFWLRWVFVAVHGFSLVVVSRGDFIVAVQGLLSVVASFVAEDRL